MKFVIQISFFVQVSICENYARVSPIRTIYFIMRVEYYLRSKSALCIRLKIVNCCVKVHRLVLTRNDLSLETINYPPCSRKYYIQSSLYMPKIPNNHQTSVYCVERYFNSLYVAAVLELCVNYMKSVCESYANRVETARAIPYI